MSHDLPRVTAFERWAGRLFLWLMRFRAVGDVPPGRKFVVIGAPHTSNWDFPLAIAYGFVRDVRLQVFVKHTMFVGPLGWLLRAVGGLPVDRTAAHGLVAHSVDTLRAADRLALVVPPSGTRSRASHWKSGFYHIATGADVPVVCCFIDFGRREVGVRDVLRLSGDVRADMDRIREVYAPIQAKFPDRVTPARLKEEDAAAPGSA